MKFSSEMPAGKTNILNCDGAYELIMRAAFGITIFGLDVKQDDPDFVFGCDVLIE